MNPGGTANRFTVGDKVTLDAENSDPIPICMQHHVVVAEADSGKYLVVLPGQSRKYGPYSESRLTPGWGLPDA